MQGIARVKREDSCDSDRCLDAQDLHKIKPVKILVYITGEDCKAPPQLESCYQLKAAGLGMLAFFFLVCGPW